MSFKNFVRELNGKRVEGELVRTVFYSLLSSLLIFFLFYFVYLKNIENLTAKYGLVLFLSILSYALITPAIRQVRAYNQFPCMSGMMVGMTIGMISGFLPGFYVASTNGMFVGGFFGVAVGIILGVWSGRCCGIMGIMEGIMSGFMGGLMGAMTAFMLINDHLKLTAIIVFLICTIILILLNYMIYKETKETEREKKEDHNLTIIISAILTFITIWLMVLGPKNPLFQ